MRKRSKHRTLLRAPGGLLVGGRYWYERFSPDGELLAWGVIRNGIVTEGLNHILETQFRSGSQVATWYIGLISSTSYSALAAADTMSSHSGWTEFTTYSESVRQTYSPGAAAAGIIINGTAARFTIAAGTAATVTAKGLFITTSSTKGGTTGTLWGHGLFETDQVLATSEVLKIKYELTAQSST